MFERDTVFNPTQQVRFVDVTSALLHVRMEDLFGLPEITNDREDEIFGPYAVDGESYFWRYDSGDDAWSVLPCPAHAVSMIVPAALDERSGMMEAFLAVRACPPAGVPSDPNIKSLGTPFVFAGWRFCWIFYPELARWELAPAGEA